MTREAFLKELDRLLRGVPVEERKEILADYEEHFYLAMEEGKVEEDIVRSLGNPKHIAKELVAIYHVEQAQTNVSAASLVRATFAVVSLGFFNLMFVLGPFIALVGMLLGLYAAALGLVVAPVVGLIGEVLQGGMSVSQFLFHFFVALAIASLGVLLLIGLLYLTKWAYAQLIRYLKFNLQIIKTKGDDK